jgi:hypothetical protein
LPLKTPKQDREKSKLHDDAPNRVTTQRAAAIETAMVKGFHPEP